ncbi:MAG TPA: hypothetical protein VMV77_03415 [Bacteroidales bacterium]|nr:hypothetical protein [Bacteroidales bacterium]
MKTEDKYKDFRDLPDNYDEQTLIELFIKRNYVRQGFDNRDANDIIISKDITEGKIDGKFIYNPDKKISFRASTHKERMIYWKELLTGGLQFPENFEIEQANFELSFLNLSEVPNRYLRKKVEAYLELCKKIIKENRPGKDEKFIQIEGFNISGLISELQSWKFFDESYYYGYRKDIHNWFVGVPPKKPIIINVHANIFISVIADLIDQGFIKNSKKFYCSYIEKSFLFKGGKRKFKYIDKVMRPNGKNRVSARNKQIPNIQIHNTSA